MITVSVYNREGAELETLKVDEGIFGGCVRYPLLKQSILMYQANKRLGTAANKNRSKVEGSTRKIYRQKGTGNARAGAVRTPVRVGGGVTFGKTARDFSFKMPRKQRRLARDSAILTKLQSGNVIVVDELGFQSPKTKEFARILSNLKISRSCLVAVEKHDENLLKSVRNVSHVGLSVVYDLNAGDICNRQKILFTREAFLALLNRDQNV